MVNAKGCSAAEASKNVERGDTPLIPLRGSDVKLRPIRPLLEGEGWRFGPQGSKGEEKDA